MWGSENMASLSMSDQDLCGVFFVCLFFGVLQIEPGALQIKSICCIPTPSVDLDDIGGPHSLPSSCSGYLRCPPTLTMSLAVGLHWQAEACNSET